MTVIPAVKLTEAGFDAAELRARLDKVRAGLERLRVDVLMVTDPDNIYYLTGARELGSYVLQAIIVGRSSPLVFAGRHVDALAFTAHTGLEAAFVYRDHEVPEEVLASALMSQGAGGARVGYEGGATGLTPRSLSDIQSRVPADEWIDATDLIWRLRARKSHQELSHIREAARINKLALDRAIGATRPGVSDSHVAAELFAGMLENGSHPMAYFSVSSGINTAFSHSTYSNRGLNAEDIILFEFSAARFRYHAPLMRTVVLGEPSRLVRQLHSAAEAGLAAALAAIRPGVTAGAVDMAANAALDERGAGAAHFARSGYSVGLTTGLYWPEGHIVSLRQGDPTVLEENMVFHLLTVLYEPGRVGAGLSETVRVTTSSVEVLTEYPRELLVA